MGLSDSIKQRLVGVRGNVSLWALGLSVFIFKAWQWYFEYPADADISVLWNLFRVREGSVAAVITFVLGWLAGIYSLKNLQKIMVSFFRPLSLVTEGEARDFFSAPATGLFSLALLVFVIDMATANVSYKISSRYEVVVSLPKGSGTFLMLPDGKIVERASLKHGQVVRIALRGRAATEVLLIRDQYNLVTLAALGFHRGSSASGTESLALNAMPAYPTSSEPMLARGSVKPTSGQTVLAGSETPAGDSTVTDFGSKRAGLFGLEITGPLRYSATPVSVMITTLKKNILRGGWLQPGTGTDCPERSGPAYARKFFQSLCDNRALFSLWDAVPAYHEQVDGSDSTVVYQSFGSYEVAVQFVSSKIAIPGDFFIAREVKELRVIEKEEKEN